MKRRNKKNKVLLVVALILCITVGYAALTTTLNITGNSKIKNAKWDIHFDNLVVDGTSVEASTPAAIDGAKTTVNYAVNLVKPGDVYSFTVDVVNEGTIDGMINIVSNTGLTTEQQKYVDYSITYGDGKELKVKDGLKAGTKRNIKVKVKYKDDLNPEDLPKNTETLDLTLTVEYVQADDTAKFPPSPIMKAYKSGEDYHNTTYQSKITKIVTKTNIDVPATAKEHWDVSAAGNGSVVAYVEDDGTGNGTYKVTIGGDGSKVVANENSSSLFRDFSSLKEIDLSNFDTSNVTNMNSMFSGCSSLTSLDLSHFNTSKVTDIGAMFMGCSSLTSLDVSNFDTSKVTGMAGIFSNCSKLTSLDLSKFNTSNVENMNSMFDRCHSLTGISLDDSFNTSKVTNMGRMFYKCNSLTSLDLSKFDTGNVTSFNSMFNGCSSLTSLDLSNFNTSKVFAMDFMFENCSSLTSLDVSNFDTSKVIDMNMMFYNCSSLTSLNLGSFDSSNVTSMNAMFAGCSKLGNLTLSNNFNTGKVTNMHSMFENCSSLTNLNLNSFDTSNVTDMSYMFYGCNSLGNLTLSNKFNTGKVTNMEAMFYNCGSLTNLSVSHFDTSSVTNMAWMFAECRNLTQMDLSGFDTSKVTKMDWMFSNCNKLLTTIKISNAAVSTYNGMFYYAAIVNGAKITVNYTNATSTLVNNMIATKDSTSNVVKGSLVS